jgi:hypothetical protein
MLLSYFSAMIPPATVPVNQVKGSVVISPVMTGSYICGLGTCLRANTHMIIQDNKFIIDVPL